VKNSAPNSCWPLALAKRTFATPAAFYVYCRDLLLDSPLNSDLPQRETRLVMAALRRAAVAGGQLGAQLSPAAALARSGVIAPNAGDAEGNAVAGGAVDGAVSQPQVLLWAVDAQNYKVVNIRVREDSNDSSSSTAETPETGDGDAFGRHFHVLLRPAAGSATNPASGDAASRTGVTFSLDSLVRGLLVETERSARQKMLSAASKTGDQSPDKPAEVASPSESVQSLVDAMKTMSASTAVQQQQQQQQWLRARPGSAELTGWATQVGPDASSAADRELEADMQQHASESLSTLEQQITGRRGNRHLTGGSHGHRDRVHQHARRRGSSPPPPPQREMSETSQVAQM